MTNKDVHVIGHKGFIGIITQFNNIPSNRTILLPEDIPSGIINKPLDKNQLGFVCKLEACAFSQETLNLLRKVNKSNDDIGDVDLFTSTDKKGNPLEIFAWLGGPMQLIDVKTATGSSSYDISLLNNFISTPDEKINDKGFKKGIDNMQNLAQPKRRI